VHCHLCSCYSLSPVKWHSYDVPISNAPLGPEGHTTCKQAIVIYLVGLQYCTSHSHTLSLSPLVCQSQKRLMIQLLKINAEWKNVSRKVCEDILLPAQLNHFISWPMQHLFVNHHYTVSKHWILWSYKTTHLALVNNSKGRQQPFRHISIVD